MKLYLRARIAAIQRILQKSRSIFKKKINIVVVSLLVLMLPVFIIVSEQKQNIKQRADGATAITFVDATGNTITQTSSPTVNIQLHAPWPVAMTTQSAYSNVAGASSYILYDDKLAPDWKDESYQSKIDYKNTSPVYSGRWSISDTPTSGWAGLVMKAPKKGFLTSSYTALQLYVRATAANENFGVYLDDTHSNRLAHDALLSNYGGYPAVNKWKLYKIPLAALNGTNRIIGTVTIQNASETKQAPIYVDQVQFVGLPSPSPSIGLP